MLSTAYRSAHRALLAATRGSRSGFAGRPGTAVTPAPISGRARPSPSDGRAPRPLPVLEVCTLRSVTSESAYVAHRLREAHLHHGLPWSRMAVIVRSLQHHHAALRRALTQAGVPTTTGAEDTALATQPAVAPILLLLRCALDSVHIGRRGRGGAAPFAPRRRRPVRRTAVAPGAARHRAGRGRQAPVRRAAGRRAA